MILFAAAGMPFKALSWAIAFIFLAKGSSKLFFWNELAVNIYSLGLNLAGFYVFGLTGLGISFLIAYAVYALQVYLISKKYFKYSINKDLLIIFIVNVVLVFNCVLLVLTFDSVYIYGIGVLLVIISILYNVSNLNNRIALKFITHSNKAI
jgi:O-antigen/teichoic acid export membrane protein